MTKVQGCTGKPGRGLLMLYSMQLLTLVAIEYSQYKHDSSYAQQDEDHCEGQSHSEANGPGATTGARSVGWWV